FFFNKPFGRGYDDGMIFALAVCDMLDRNRDKSMADLRKALPKTWGSPTMSPHCDDEKKYAVVDAVVKHFESAREEGKKVAGQPIRELVTVNGVRVTVEEAPGAWSGRRPTSRSSWSWSRARFPSSACATCFRPSMACCARIQKWALIIRRFDCPTRHAHRHPRCRPCRTLPRISDQAPAPGNGRLAPRTEPGRRHLWLRRGVLRSRSGIPARRRRTDLFGDNAAYAIVERHHHHSSRRAGDDRRGRLFRHRPPQVVAIAAVAGALRRRRACVPSFCEKPWRAGQRRSHCRRRCCEFAGPPYQRDSRRCQRAAPDQLLRLFRH